MDKQNDGIGILVCGSQKFDDKAFVINTLETLYIQTKGNIARLYTSKFSGACEFAQQWVEMKNETLPENAKIKLEDCTFDLNLNKNNNSLYEELDIPKFVLENDEFFQSGKMKIMEKKIKCVLAFPNPEGVLGPSTRNIQRFATLAGIAVLDCSNLLDKIKEYRKEVQEQEVVEDRPNLQLKNKHPNKFK